MITHCEPQPRCLRGMDVCIGAVDLVGVFDIGAKQRQMNTLKKVPVSVAQALLQYGQQAIDYARSTVTKLGLQDGGDKKRDEVYWKLKWHEAELSKASPTALAVYLQYQYDSNAFKQAGASLAAMYPYGDDLKNWVMQAFVQANAVEEGAAYIAAAWSTMWSTIGAAIAALPEAVMKAVKDVSNELAWYAKSTYWFAIGGGVIALGIISWGVSSGIKSRISGK